MGKVSQAAISLCMISGGQQDSDADIYISNNARTNKGVHTVLGENVTIEHLKHARHTTLHNPIHG